MSSQPSSLLPLRPSGSRVQRCWRQGQRTTNSMCYWTRRCCSSWRCSARPQTATPRPPQVRHPSCALQQLSPVCVPGSDACASPAAVPLSALLPTLLSPDPPARPSRAAAVWFDAARRRPQRSGRVGAARRGRQRHQRPGKRGKADQGDAVGWVPGRCCFDWCCVGWCCSGWCCYSPVCKTWGEVAGQRGKPDQGMAGEWVWAGTVAILCSAAALPLLPPLPPLLIICWTVAQDVARLQAAVGCC